MGTSYIDPQLRIARVVGEKYPNIYEVYLRDNGDNGIMSKKNTSM